MAATATPALSGPRYAPEDPTLPKPWRGLVDGKSGFLYFWNPETNVTQYERPTASGTTSKSCSAPISSSDQVQQSSHCGYSTAREDDRHGRGSNSGSNSDAGQGIRGGPAQYENISNVTVSGPGGSSATGHGSSAGGSSLSAEAYRHRHEISVTGDKVPPPLTSFEVTGFPAEILQAVHNAGFSSPTPIQAQSWPIALQNSDIVAISKTGSGKTLGYLIPGFIHLRRYRNNPRLGPTVLVLSPTRELATQIQCEAVKFGESSRISCTCLYGGAPKGPQLKELDRGVDIVVATPGRLNDILEMRRVSLSQVSYLVLDEADRMLDMGFEPQIRKIVKEVPVRRQTLMYTATWPKEVRKIASDLLVNPVQVNIGNVDELVANKSITQYIEVLAPIEKHRRLEQILQSQEPGSKIIIFCSTKKMCDQLAHNLTRQFGAAAIHGDKSQGERDQILNQFRTGRSPVLVATDVAARGLDIKGIRVVINYDFPTGVEDYVHRIGRTGRSGATGLAYTFFGDQDAKHAADLIKILEGSSQRVPPELRDVASRGGGMSRPRRWGSGSGGYDGNHGGQNDFGHGGRDGGRGSWGMSGPSSAGGHGYGHESRDRSDRGYNDGYGERRGRSPSPNKASGWGEHTHGSDRHDRSVPNPGGSPVRSFHQSMMERGRASPPPVQRERSRSPYGGGGGSFHKTMMEGAGNANCYDKHTGGHDRSPVCSFHQLMMGRDRRSPLRRSRSPHGTGGSSFCKAMTEHGRSSSYNNNQQEWGRSSGGEHDGREYRNGPISNVGGDEEEEGMIRPDDDDI